MVASEANIKLINSHLDTFGIKVVDQSTLDPKQVSAALGKVVELMNVGRSMADPVQSPIKFDAAKGVSKEFLGEFSAMVAADAVLGLTPEEKSSFWKIGENGADSSTSLIMKALGIGAIKFQDFAKAAPAVSAALNNLYEANALKLQTAASQKPPVKLTESAEAANTVKVMLAVIHNDGASGILGMTGPGNLTDGKFGVTPQTSLMSAVLGLKMGLVGSLDIPLDGTYNTAIGDQIENAARDLKANGNTELFEKLGGGDVDKGQKELAKVIKALNVLADPGGPLSETGKAVHLGPKGALLNYNQKASTVVAPPGYALWGKVKDKIDPKYLSMVTGFIESTGFGDFIYSLLEMFGFPIRDMLGIKAPDGSSLTRKDLFDADKMQGFYADGFKNLMKGGFDAGKLEKMNTVLQGLSKLATLLEVQDEKTQKAINEAIKDGLEAAKEAAVAAEKSNSNISVDELAKVAAAEFQRVYAKGMEGVILKLEKSSAKNNVSTGANKTDKFDTNGILVPGADNDDEQQNDSNKGGKQTQTHKVVDSVDEKASQTKEARAAYAEAAGQEAYDDKMKDSRRRNKWALTPDNSNKEARFVRRAQDKYNKAFEKALKEWDEKHPSEAGSKHSYKGALTKTANAKFFEGTPEEIALAVARAAKREAHENDPSLTADQLQRRANNIYRKTLREQREYQEQESEFNPPPEKAPWYSGFFNRGARHGHSHSFGVNARDMSGSGFTLGTVAEAYIGYRILDKIF